MSTLEKNVDLWYTVCPVPTASGLAIARGDLDDAFSAEPGVALQSIRAHADRSVREAHYNQSQANAFREGGNIPPIWARSAGRQLKIIGLSWIDHYSTILTLPGSGIREPRDLRGKRLGLVKRPNDPVDYPRATALHGYVAALESVGLSTDDVTFVDIPIVEPLVAKQPEPGALSRSLFSARGMRRRQGFELRALLRGEVDAIHASTQGVEIQDLIAAEVVFDVTATTDPDAQINNTTPVAFTVRGELLQERPDLVTKYVAATLRAARWARANEAEAKRLIARDTGIAEELVDHAYSPAVVASLGPSLSDSLIDKLNKQKAFLHKYGFLVDDFDFESFITPEPLEEAERIVAAEDLAATA